MQRTRHQELAGDKAGFPEEVRGLGRSLLGTCECPNVWGNVCGHVQGERECQARLEPLPGPTSLHTPLEEAVPGQGQSWQSSPVPALPRGSRPEAAGRALLAPHHPSGTAGEGVMEAAPAPRGAQRRTGSTA